MKLNVEQAIIPNTQTENDNSNSTNTSENGAITTEEDTQSNDQHGNASNGTTTDPQRGKTMKIRSMTQI